MTNIQFVNGVAIDLCDGSDRFLGIGSVKAAGVELRDPVRPASVDVRTPDGFQLSDWKILERQITDKQVRLDMAPLASGGGLMEWMLHEVRPRVNTSDWNSGPVKTKSTRMTAQFDEVWGQFGLPDAVGFRYQYHYQSSEYPIYKITDRSSWEVGGRAVGNCLWIRNSFAPCLAKFQSIDDTYSTEWFLPSASNSNIFQFYPWQTALEGFSLTFHNSGALVTWATKVSHVRSLFEKQSGVDAIFHWHEHCGDLSGTFSSAPMEVVWIPGHRDITEQWNLYEQVREFVAQALHEDIGMTRDRVAPYGVIEEWQVPDMNRYREKALPKFLEAGIKTIFLPNEFENNMNTFGVSNMCCTIDYKVSEVVGEDKLSNFCNAALESGMQVEMWGNTALSTLVPITGNREKAEQRIDFLPVRDSIFEVLDQSKDPYVRNAAGAMEADHYTPVFAQLNLRDETIWRYWMKQWTYAYEKLGIRGIFLDSSFNMTSDKFHWIANSNSIPGRGATVDQTHLLGKTRAGVEIKSKILSQYRAHLDLMVEMQRVGYFYCGEDTGVFGIHRSGPSVTHRLDNIPMWSDSITTFDPAELKRNGADPDMIYFQGLAYRMMWFIFWLPEKDMLSFSLEGNASDSNEPTSWHFELLKAYAQVDAGMGSRKVLIDGSGVAYSSKQSGQYILWSFSGRTINLPHGTHVTDVLAKLETVSSFLAALPLKVYQIVSLEPIPEFS